MSTASDLYYTQVRDQLDPIQWEALTRREQAGWEHAARILAGAEALIPKWRSLYGRYSSATARMTLADCEDDLRETITAVTEGGDR